MRQDKQTSGDSIRDGMQRPPEMWNNPATGKERDKGNNLNENNAGQQVGKEW